MPKKHSIGFYTFAVLFVFALCGVGNWVERHQTTPLLLSFMTAFICYLFLLQNQNAFKFLFAVGILTRLTLFFSLPALSDDIYRFIWDGTLLKNGIHPFAELPGHYLDQNVSGLNQVLYEKLNSPRYFSIYPPLNQFIFWLSVQLNDDWLTSTNIIRVFIFAADIGSFFVLRTLLKTYEKKESWAFCFFLNPLVILEFVGNVHFEGIVIFFLLAGILYYEKNRNALAASSIGLAIGTKLLPMIYLPYLFIAGTKNRRWWVAFLAGAVGVLTLLPMVDRQFIEGMQSSLDLYFRKFEFNASLYFVARKIGIGYYGYNNIAKIGPLLSMLSIVTILAISILGTVKKWSLPKVFLFILTAYLLFTTTVHPWYILPLLAFGILAGYWYPVIWSGTIFMTYAGYSTAGFELPMWIVVVEYLLVTFAFIVESLAKEKLNT